MIAAVNLMINIYINFSNTILLLLMKIWVLWLIFFLLLTLSFSAEFVICAISANCAYPVHFGMSIETIDNAESVVYSAKYDKIQPQFRKCN
jgi:hypothetical protein